MADQPQPFRGPTTDSTGATAEDEASAARIANRFDIRRIIGGVFVLYAVILIVTGLIGGHEVKTKAAGINVDLWTGIGMLIVGALMITWALTRPVALEPAGRGGEGSGELSRSPAT